MTKRTFILVLILAVATGLCSIYAFNPLFRGAKMCGQEMETNPVVAEFNKLEVHNGIAVNFTQAATRSVTIKTDKSLMPYVYASVVNGTLVLHIEDEADLFSNRGRVVDIIISNPHLNEFHATGGSVLKIENTLSATNFSGVCKGGSILKGKIESSEVTLALSGGSIVECELLNNERLHTGMSGGSIANVVASTKRLSCEASGGSILKGVPNCHDALVSASGGSVVNLGSVANLMSAKASGGSIVTYKGEPKNCRNDLSGGAVCIRKD